MGLNINQLHSVVQFIYFSLYLTSGNKNSHQYTASRALREVPDRDNYGCIIGEGQPSAPLKRKPAEKAGFTLKYTANQGEYPNI